MGQEREEQGAMGLGGEIAWRGECVCVYERARERDRVSDRERERD